MVFPHYRQIEEKTCGPTCLYIISKYYSKRYSKKFIDNLCVIEKDGVSVLGMCNALKKMGFTIAAVKIPFNILINIKLPCIALLNNNHFIVIFKISTKKIYISDPASTLNNFLLNDFRKMWVINRNIKSNGIAIIIKPNDKHVSNRYGKSNPDSDFIVIH